MTPAQSKTKFKEYLSSIIIFTILIVIFTFPLVNGFRTHIAGFGDDNWGNIWNLSWVSQALVSSADLYQTPMLFHPLNANLVFHTLTPFHGFIAFPIKAFCGLIPAFNMLVMLDLLLASFAMFLLSRFLGNGFYPSLFAGFIFAFGPYSIMHAMLHLSLMGIGWIAIYLLFLIKFINTTRIADCTGTVVAAIILAYTSPTYLLLSGIVSLIWLPLLLIKIFRKRILSKCFLYIISASIIFFIAVSPIIVQAIKESSREGMYYQSPPRAAKHWGADLYSFVTPPNFHWFFRPGPIGSELSFDAYNSTHRPWFNGPVYSGKGSEAALYIGIPVFLLALLGVLKAKNLKHKPIWIITGICFLTLSLGPVLIIKGHVLPENPERFTHYPLPFAYLMDIPIFGGLRMPARCHAVTSLVVSLLAAAGVHHILTSTSRKSLRWFLFSGVFFVSAVDFASIPWPRTTAEIPEVYRVIRDDPEPGSVLDLPPGWRTGDYVDFTERTIFQYYQIHHQRPIPYGQISRVPRWKLDYFNRNQLLNWFRKSSLEDKAPAYPDFVRQWAKTTSEVFDVSFIVVHKNAYIHNKKKALVTEKQYQLFCQNISIWFDVKQITQYADKTLFQIEKKVADKGKYIDFSLPWSSVYIAQGIPPAWSPEPWIEGNKASLLIPFNTKTSYSFKIQIRSLQGKPNDPPQTITININDRAYEKVTVSDKEWQNIKIDIPSDCITRVPTQVNMEFSRMNSPWELWREPDIRDLAVQIKSMEWQPLK